MIVRPVMMARLVLLLVPTLCQAVTRIEVVKSWSAVVTEVGSPNYQKNT